MKITYQYRYHYQKDENQYVRLVRQSVIMNEKTRHLKSQAFTFTNLQGCSWSKTISKLRFDKATTDRFNIFSLARSVTLACPWKDYDVQFFYLCDMVNSDPSFQTQAIELDTAKDIELFNCFINLMQFTPIALARLLMRVNLCKQPRNRLTTRI